MGAASAEFTEDPFLASQAVKLAIGKQVLGLFALAALDRLPRGPKDGSKKSIPTVGLLWF
jgi:hypothetical protein